MTLNTLSRIFTTFNPPYRFATMSNCVQEPFHLKKALVLTKFSRYEFEKRRNPGLTEEQLHENLKSRGSDVMNLRHHHAIHSSNRDQIVKTLCDAGIETKLVNRFEYRKEDIDWADAVITAGGDGTFLMAASRILDARKPVIGINSDPESSVGHLCLPSQFSCNLKPVLEKIERNEFEWKMRQRIRVTVQGEDADEEPIELHDQQLQHPEYRFLDLESRVCEDSTISASSDPDTSRRTNLQEASSDPDTSRRTNLQEPSMRKELPIRKEPPTRKEPPIRKELPIRALNEVFIGETLSSRVSYYELSIDSSPLTKMRSSGLTVSTGTGSTSWFFNINKLTPQCVHSLIQIIKEEGHELQLTGSNILQITNRFNDSLVFDPSHPHMAYTIRDPIVFSTPFSSNPRGFASNIKVRSRMFDACIVLDGGLSYKFNDGAVATLQVLPEDALKTIQIN